MVTIPEKKQQILAVHAMFIRQVVTTSQNVEQQKEYQALLAMATENGYTDLVGVIQRIVAGERNDSVFQKLDEEDQVIAESILLGLQNPDTLPDTETQADPAAAAPGLAAMIQAASTGNVQALQLISNMAEQMSKAGGPMARLAAVIRPLINGERDPDKLCKGMNTQTEQMVLGILDILKKPEDD